MFIDLRNANSGSTFELCRATAYNDLNLMENLIKTKKANPNIHVKDGQTALHVSAHYGHVEAAKLLLKNGALINSKDDHGWSPLYYAVSEGHIDMVEFLLEKKASVQLVDGYNNTLLHIAIKNREDELYEDEDNNIFKYDQIIIKLIKHGASLEIKNKDDKTPLDYLKSKKNKDILQELYNSQTHSCYCNII